MLGVIQKVDPFVEAYVCMYARVCVNVCMHLCMCALVHVCALCVQTNERCLRERGGVRVRARLLTGAADVPLS
jgi:hypothetical protein